MTIAQIDPKSYNSSMEWALYQRQREEVWRAFQQTGDSNRPPEVGNYRHLFLALVTRRISLKLTDLSIADGQGIPIRY